MELNPLERRLTPRTVCSHLATAFIDDRNVACVVEDVSARGAALALQVETDLPDRFRLHMDGREAVAVKVVWRNGSRCGVIFWPPSL